MATVISAIVIGAIAGVLIVTLESYPRSAARLSLSDNAQLLSSTFIPDVQSAAWNAQGIQIGAPTYIPPHCAAAVPTSGNVVTLTWSDFDQPGVTYMAAYSQVGSELMRYFCKDTGTNATVVPTIVGRNIGPNGAKATQTMDSVNIAVQTLDLVNGTGSGYNFSVSASRRTPALRIYPVPDLTPSFLADPDSTISGTAMPDAGTPGHSSLTLSISDQASPPDTTSPTQPISADLNGNWSVPVADISWSALKVGDLITFTVTSTDPAGNTSTAITTSRKPFIPEVSTYPGENNPTNTLPVNFLVTFPEVPLGLDISHFTATGPGNTDLSKFAFLTQNVPCLATAPPGSACDEVTIIGGLDTTDDAGDGPVTLTVQAHTVQDAAGNWNLASVPYSIQWDLNLPTVTPNPPSPTSTQPVTFLIAFPHALKAPLDGNGDQLKVIAPAADLAVLKKDVDKVNPCPASAPPGSATCFTVSISNLPTTPAAEGPISVQVNPNVVTDIEYGGPNSASAPSAPVLWSTTFTISETPGPGATTTFSGVAGPAPVTVTICNNAACSIPAPEPPVTVDATGHWSTTVATSVLAGNQYAEAMQTDAAGQPATVFTKLSGP